MNGRIRLSIILAMALGAFGCAPIEYSAVIVGASQAIAAAKTAGAGCTEAQLTERSPVTKGEIPDPGTELASTEEKKPRSSLDGQPMCSAPYEFYSAQEYLAKAREEVGYSDYEAAVEYARKSREFAYKAKEIAIRFNRERGR